MIGGMRRNDWPLGWTSAIIGCIAVSSYLSATYAMDTWPWPDRRPLRERYVFHSVGRWDLAPILQAAGRMESSRRTTIRCQLENMTGSRAGMTSASTVLTLVPEGSMVKEGDVLATLDSSTYDEMLRQQVITVEQAKASYLQAQLNYEIALLAVREYRDGTVLETLKGMEGQIALARSDLSRALDHLSWTKRMKEKGYSSVATIVSEEHSVSQLKVSLQRQLTSMDLYQRFTLPKTEKTLQAQVKSTDTNLKNESLRLQRQLDRLETLKKQVERCTIRAPHDGLLCYHQDTETRGRPPEPVAEGMAVRQRQILFYLPDLSEMEAQVILNESIVDRVMPGLRAKVRFEALPDAELDGRLASIGQIPGGQSRNGEDIRFFIAVVKLDTVVAGLKPNMSTRVDIALPLRRHVVAVPHQVLRLDGGKKVCFVAHGENLERREVAVGQGTTDMIEITDGLHEGDLVALDPPGVLGPVSPLMDFDDIEHGESSGTATVAASNH
jgi:HlyD family secretion protein